MHSGRRRHRRRGGAVRAGLYADAGVEVYAVGAPQAADASDAVVAGLAVVAPDRPGALAVVFSLPSSSVRSAQVNGARHSRP